jgi:hypothetical protein
VISRLVLVTALAVTAGCASDPLDLEPVGDYSGWKQFATWGDTPGHGDTYRIIYANPDAEKFGMPEPPAEVFGGEYWTTSIVVKEVYERIGDGPGALQIVEIMRRTSDKAYESSGGWLFSDAATPDGPETEKTFCWRRCHQAAPFAGAWFDYSK